MEAGRPLNNLRPPCNFEKNWQNFSEKNCEIIDTTKTLFYESKIALVQYNNDVHKRVTLVLRQSKKVRLEVGTPQRNLLLSQVFTAVFISIEMGE